MDEETSERKKKTINQINSALNPLASLCPSLFLSITDKRHTSCLFEEQRSHCDGRRRRQKG